MTRQDPVARRELGIRPRVRRLRRPLCRVIHPREDPPRPVRPGIPLEIAPHLPDAVVQAPQRGRRPRRLQPHLRDPQEVGRPQQALGLRPRLPRPAEGVQRLEGNAQVAAGDHAGAIERFRKAIAALPDTDRTASAWNDMGWALQQLGRHEKAVAAYRKALRLQPAFPLARNNLDAAQRQLDLRKSERERQQPPAGK